MAASGYVASGDLSRVAKAGDTMSGTLELLGANPLQIPEGAADGDLWTSDAEGNGSWQTPAESGGGIPETIVQAKGDLVGASGPDTPVRIPVGANGTFLVAASGQSDGVQWRDLVAGDVPYLNQSTTGSAGNSTTAASAAVAGFAQAAVNSTTAASAAYSATAGSAVNSTLSGSASSAGYAISALNSIAAGSAVNSTTATSAAYAATAGSSTSAVNSTTALSAAYSATALSATNATLAGSAGYVQTASNATTSSSAAYAASAGSATSATNATTASSAAYSSTAGSSINSTTASSAAYAASAGGATVAMGAVVPLTLYNVTSNSGSSASASRSDHVHGVPDGYFHDTPAKRGWSEWNVPLMQPNTAQVFVTGSIAGCSFIAETNNTVTHVGVVVDAVAATPVTGEDLIAVYSVSGNVATQVAITGDLGTWGGTGFQSYAFTNGGFTLVQGTTYLVLLLSVATTPVKLYGPTLNTISYVNAGLSQATQGPWYKFFTNAVSGATGMPSPSFVISSSTMSQTSVLFPWICLY